MSHYSLLRLTFTLTRVQHVYSLLYAPCSGACFGKCLLAWWCSIIHQLLSQITFIPLSEHIYSTLREMCSHTVNIQIYEHRHSSIQILTQKRFFPNRLSALSLNSFGMLNDWKSVAIRLLIYHRYICQWNLCVRACVCSFMCVSASVKTKRQSSEYFIPVRWVFPCAASQCRPLKHAGMHSESNAHTHTPVPSASVAVDSVGHVCRGFVPERPPCTRTCRQDLKPCCTPASLPLSLDTNPAHKQALC